MTVGTERTRCIQGAGRSGAATAKASRMTLGATAKTTKTARPSPLSANLRSSPQLSQTGATLRKPENRSPSPQRGHLQAKPALKGETRESVMRLYGAPALAETQGAGFRGQGLV